MVYTVTDKYHRLIIRLKTNISVAPVLTFKHIENINVTNINTAMYTTYSATGTLEDGIITYKISMFPFEAGDILKDFKFELQGANNLYDLNEGITILIDGEESEVIQVSNGQPVKDGEAYKTFNPVNTDKFATVFLDQDEHTVQAIFKGNNSIGVVLSEKLIITPKVKDDPNPATEGGYLIEFTKFQDKMTYMGNVDWQVRLTKGGVGVPDQLIQIDTPASTNTGRTDSEGYVTLKRNKNTAVNWHA